MRGGLDWIGFGRGEDGMGWDGRMGGCGSCGGGWGEELGGGGEGGLKGAGFGSVGMGRWG